MAVIENSRDYSSTGKSILLQRQPLMVAVAISTLVTVSAFGFYLYTYLPFGQAHSIRTQPLRTPDMAMDSVHVPGMHISEMTGPVAGRPQSVLTPLSCQKLPDIPGKTMTTMLVDYPPNGFTPRHRHPGNVTAIVLKGTIRSQLVGGPAVDYKKGQSWFEPPGAIHLFAENISNTESAQMIAIFVADTDCGALVIPDTGN